MGENTVVITERGGKYEIQNNGISEFALLGILECIVFDLKTANRRESGAQRIPSATQPKKVIPEPIDKPNETIPNTKEVERVEELKDAAPETKREVAPSAVPDLRTRISNAIKAIRGLGAKIEDADLSNLTDEELQSELEELTSQYKRLKTSKGTK
jgi:hypothetical protein